MRLIWSQDLVMSYLFATIKNAVPIVINLAKLWTKSDSKSLPLAFVKTITSIRTNKHRHSPYSTLAQSKLLLWGSRQLRVPAPPSWITVSTTVWPFSSRDFRIYKKKQTVTVDWKHEFFVVSNHLGVYISENSNHHYLSDWAYLRKKSGGNTVKEWSENKKCQIWTQHPRKHLHRLL